MARSGSADLAASCLLFGGLCCKTILFFAAGAVLSIRQLVALSADSV